MEQFIYFPVTHYHIILSFILREQNKSQLNSIILDESCFNKTLIKKIINIGHWDNVYVIKMSSRLSLFMNRYIFYRLKYKDIFNIKNANMVVFTFGNTFANLLVNSIYKNNNILMGEDGLFPYYGLAIVKEYYNMIRYNNINKLRRFMKNIINSRTEFNIQRINKFLLLNPEWSPKELVQQYETEHVILEQKDIQKVFDELTCLYDYKEENIFNDIDIIYFDSDFSTEGLITEREEYDILYKIFKTLNNLTIFIKLKPNNSDLINTQRKNFYYTLQKATACNLVINSSGAQYPWEIVCFNNAAAIKDIIFMSPIFSTALITPKKFFGIENDIICFQNILLKEAAGFSSSTSFDDLIVRIRCTYLSKSIYNPKLPNDIRAFISKILTPNISKSH